MKTTHLLPLLMLFLITPCMGLMSIELVTKERAKELGMEIRTTQAGPEMVRIELEFKTDGALKNYSRVDLEISQNGKTLSTSVLREEKSSPGVIIVGFAADRASLDQMSLRVVTQSGLRTMIGHVLKVGDFIPAAKPK